MALEALGRLLVVEYSLEGGIFESRTVDIAGNPVVVEDGGTYLGVIHVVGGASDSSVVLPGLPD